MGENQEVLLMFPKRKWSCWCCLVFLVRTMLFPFVRPTAVGFIFFMVYIATQGLSPNKLTSLTGHHMTFVNLNYQNRDNHLLHYIIIGYEFFCDKKRACMLFPLLKCITYPLTVLISTVGFL